MLSHTNVYRQGVCIGDRREGTKCSSTRKGGEHARATRQDRRHGGRRARNRRRKGRGSSGRARTSAPPCPSQDGTGRRQGGTESPGGDPPDGNEGQTYGGRRSDIREASPLRTAKGAVEHEPDASHEQIAKAGEPVTHTQRSSGGPH